MKRIKAAALLGMCMAVFTACRGKADVNSVSELEQGIQAVEEGMELFTPETRIQDVIDDPAFEGFGRLVFPVDLGLEGTLTLKEAGNRLVWYSHVNPERTVSIVNEMKARVQRGEKIFYDIYTDEEKKKDHNFSESQ